MGLCYIATVSIKKNKKNLPNFRKLQFTHVGEKHVSCSSGYRLSEEASSIRSISVTAISAVSLEPISIFLILRLAVKGGCLRWPIRSYRS